MNKIIEDLENIQDKIIINTIETEEIIKRIRSLR